MINSLGSDIPLARAHLYEAVAYCVMDATARRHCLTALSLMSRRSAVRRAPVHQQRITPEQKRRVRALQHSEMTMHEIANAVGLANGGRVSEIMTHKR
jgi:hypothetical protein